MTGLEPRSSDVEASATTAAQALFAPSFGKGSRTIMN